MQVEIKIIGDTKDASFVSVLALLAGVGGTVISGSGTSIDLKTGTVTMSGDDEEDDTAPAAAVQPGELDKNGLPWDERIHSGKKSKNKDGSWRYLKGVSPDLITATEAELRARIAAAPAAPVVPPPMFDAGTNQGAPAAAPTLPPPAAPPVAAPPIPPAPVAAAVAAPPVAAPAAAPAVPLTPVAEGALGFPEFMGVVSSALTGGKLAEARIAELCGLLQIASIGEIAASPLKIAQAYNWLLEQKLLMGT